MAIIIYFYFPPRCVCGVSIFIKYRCLVIDNRG